MDQQWKIQRKNVFTYQFFIKMEFFPNCREEAEFLISGDHDHYISSAETIVLQNEESVAYEEAIEEPRAKKRKWFPNEQVVFKINFIIFYFTKSIEKLSPKKQQTTYQIISDDHTKNKIGKTIAISASNIIEESFANASNDIFTTFEEVTDDIKQSTLLSHHGSNIEVISSTPIAAQSNNHKPDEFDIFGNFVAEVMRNMTKSKSRILQMNIMKLIADAESDS